MLLSSPAGLNYTPGRIISLVPSQTELLHNLGLTDEVVGITKFCVHPAEWLKTKAKIGGTKNIYYHEIEQLQPDLIIANKEENEQFPIETLAKKFPVLVTDVHCLTEALQMINDIGVLTGKQSEAKHLIKNIELKFQQLPIFQAPVKMLYLIWQKPYMTIGGDTFINNMLEKCGLQNVFAGKKRYPEITIDQIKETDFQLLLLPSEPYPFQQKHLTDWQKTLPNRKIQLVNGEYFSWYGSRLLYAPDYFREIFNGFN